MKKGVLKKIIVSAAVIVVGFSALIGCKTNDKEVDATPEPPAVEVTPTKDPKEVLKEEMEQKLHDFVKISSCNFVGCYYEDGNYLAYYDVGDIKGGHVSAVMKFEDENYGKITSGRYFTYDEKLVEVIKACENKPAELAEALENGTVVSYGNISMGNKYDFKTKEERMPVNVVIMQNGVLTKYVINIVITDTAHHYWMENILGETPVPDAILQGVISAEIEIESKNVMENENINNFEKLSTMSLAPQLIK